MDPAAPLPPPAAADEEEWDAEGFEIPSLNTIQTVSKKEKPVETLRKPLNTENLYLGPHGAKPGLKIQQQQQLDGKKQRFKQKLRDAELRNNGNGRENKVEALRDLVGGKAGVLRTPKSNSASEEWLDPHCQESLFQHPKTRH